MSSSAAKRKREQMEKIKTGTSYNDYLEKQKHFDERKQTNEKK